MVRHDLRSTTATATLHSNHLTCHYAVSARGSGREGGGRGSDRQLLRARFRHRQVAGCSSPSASPSPSPCPSCPAATGRVVATAPSPRRWRRSPSASAPWSRRTAAPGPAEQRRDASLVRDGLGRLTSQPLVAPDAVRLADNGTERHHRLAASDTLAQQVRVTSGRLPQSCVRRRLRRCCSPVPGRPRRRRALGLVVVGTGERTDPLLLPGTSTRAGRAGAARLRHRRRHGASPRARASSRAARAAGGAAGSRARDAARRAGVPPTSRARSATRLSLKIRALTCSPCPTTRCSAGTTAQPRRGAVRAGGTTAVLALGFVLVKATAGLRREHVATAGLLRRRVRRRAALLRFARCSRRRDSQCSPACRQRARPGGWRPGSRRRTAPLAPPARVARDGCRRRLVPVARRSGPRGRRRDHGGAHCWPPAEEVVGVARRPSSRRRVPRRATRSPRVAPSASRRSPTRCRWRCHFSCSWPPRFRRSTRVVTTGVAGQPAPAVRRRRRTSRRRREGAPSPTHRCHGRLRHRGGRRRRVRRRLPRDAAGGQRRHRGVRRSHHGAPHDRAAGRGSRGAAGICAAAGSQRTRCCARSPVLRTSATSGDAVAVLGVDPIRSRPWRGGTARSAPPTRDHRQRLLTSPAPAARSRAHGRDAHDPRPLVDARAGHVDVTAWVATADGRERAACRCSPATRLHGRCPTSAHRCSSRRSRCARTSPTSPAACTAAARELLHAPDLAGRVVLGTPTGVVVVWSGWSSRTATQARASSRSTTRSRSSRRRTPRLAARAPVPVLVDPVTASHGTSLRLDLGGGDGVAATVVGRSRFPRSATGSSWPTAPRSPPPSTTTSPETVRRTRSGPRARRRSSRPARGGAVRPARRGMQERAPPP